MFINARNNNKDNTKFTYMLLCKTRYHYHETGEI